MNQPSVATSALDSYEPSLDGLRGICIAAVVTYHACAFNGFAETMRGGFIGVSVFFTLSGFLITSLLLRETATRGRLSLSNFWARRIRRLWPAALVVVAAVLLFSLGDTMSARRSDVIAATWNFTNWHVIAGGQDNLLQTIVGPLGPTWSLAVEEQFYIVLALLVAAVAPSRHTTRLLLGVSVAGVAIPIALANTVTDWHPALEFNTALRLPELFMGVGLAVGWRSGRAWKPSSTFAELIAAGGVAAMVALFLFADYTPPWLLRGGYTLVAALTCLTIVGLLHHGRVSTLLAAAPLRGLGIISYSLYLVHWPVITLLSGQRLDVGGGQRVIISISVAVAVAWVLHLAVERPFRRLRTAPLPTIGTGIAAAAGLTLVAWMAL